MAWRYPATKPLSEPMMVCLLTHICITRPQSSKQKCSTDKSPCLSPNAEFPQEIFMTQLQVHILLLGMEIRYQQNPAGLLCW